MIDITNLFQCCEEDGTRCLNNISFCALTVSMCCCCLDVSLHIYMLLTLINVSLIPTLIMEVGFLIYMKFRNLVSYVNQRLYQ